jgi:hypothetical protein
MISFTRNGKSVMVSVEYVSRNIKTRLYTYYECGSEILAESLSLQLQESLEKTIEREIKTAYEAGYKAGRGKKTKRTWFHTYLTHINSEIQDWKKL